MTACYVVLKLSQLRVTGGLACSETRRQHCCTYPVDRSITGSQCTVRPAICSSFRDICCDTRDATIGE